MIPFQTCLEDFWGFRNLLDSEEWAFYELQWMGATQVNFFLALKSLLKAKKKITISFYKTLQLNKKKNCITVPKLPLFENLLERNLKGTHSKKELLSH